MCCGVFAAYSEVTNRCVMWMTLSDCMGLEDKALKMKCLGMIYRKLLLSNTASMSVTDLK